MGNTSGNIFSAYAHWLPCVNATSDDLIEAFGSNKYVGKSVNPFKTLSSATYYGPNTILPPLLFISIISFFSLPLLDLPKGDQRKSRRVRFIRAGGASRTQRSGWANGGEGTWDSFSLHIWYRWYSIIL